MDLKLKIESITDVTEEIRLFEVISEAELPLPAYSAGAHIELDLGSPGIRSYSLIDFTKPPASPESYRFAVQREVNGDGGSIAMHGFAVGHVLDASAPLNDFKLVEYDGTALLLAGGIGVTPIISMAAALRDQQRPFQLHYCGRNSGVMAFTEQMTAAFGDELKLYTDDSNPLVLAELFATLASDIQVYFCGPAGLLEAAREAALAAGINQKNIHIELFVTRGSTTSSSTDETPFEVEVLSTGQVYTIPAGKSIIDVLDAAGVDLMFDCQRGDCGICQTDVISGEPEHRDVVLSDDEKQSGKVMQICVSRAKSDRLVLDL